MNIPRNSRADRRRRVFLKSRLKTPRARDLYRSLISRLRRSRCRRTRSALAARTAVVIGYRGTAFIKDRINLKALKLLESFSRLACPL